MAENNNEVQSEVPGSQNMRGDADENAESSSKPKIISSFIEVHTEVGDGEKVVRRHQVIRNGDNEKETSTEEKQTKIPISRLRQTVEKVKAKRRNSKEKPKESKIPRRSSLPKTAEPKTEEPKSLPPIPLDDEFDKLFQDAVKDNRVASLESKFEEIRHDYDENKIQPIDVDKIKKSKIPFLKRRSLNDGDSVQFRNNKILAARDKVRLKKSISNNDEKYEKISKDIVESINSEIENTKPEDESPKTVKNETDEIQITKLESEFKIQSATGSNMTNTISEIKLIKTISQDSERSDFDIQKTESEQYDFKTTTTLTQISSTDNENDTFKAVKLLKQAFENINDDSPKKVTRITKSFSQENETSTFSKETKIMKSYSYENDQKESSFKSENNEIIESNEISESKNEISKNEDNSKLNETPQKYEAKFYNSFSIDSENDLTSHKIVSAIFESQNKSNNNKLSEENYSTNIEEQNNKTESIENNKNYFKSISVEENRVKYSVQVDSPNEKSTVHDPVAKALEMHGFVVKKSEVQEPVVKNIETHEFVFNKPDIHESVYKKLELHESRVPNAGPFEGKTISRDLKIEFGNKDNENKAVNDYSKITSTDFKKEPSTFDKIQSDLKQNEFEIPKSKVPSTKETGRYGLKQKERDVLYATTFKGKVGRMISKIDSKENIELERNYSIEETPKQKSILSRIAMFERNEPETFKPKNTRPKLSKLVTKDIQPETVRVHVHTPLIVHEVFKPFHANQALIAESIKNEPPITEIEEYTHIETEEPETLPQENVPNIKPFKFDIPEPTTPISDVPVIIPKIRPVREILSKFENKDKEVLKAKPSNYTLSKNEVKTEVNKVENTKTFDHILSKNEVRLEENKVFNYDIIKNEVKTEETEVEITNTIYRSLSKNEAKAEENKFFDYDISKSKAKTEETEVEITKIFDFSLSKYEINAEENKTFNNNISKNEAKTEENEVEIPSEEIKVDVTSNIEIKQEIIEQPKTDITKINTEKESEIIKKEPRIPHKIAKSNEFLPNGNVKKILHRIKSFDKFELNRKEVSINIKELPRQRSVLEKIALFEGKLTPIRGQVVETTTFTTSLTTTTVPTTTNTVPATTTTVPTTTAASEELEEKINELKTNYGSVVIPGVQLNNGVTMPVLAVGTANLNPKLIKHIIGAAIDMGYRAIDSAYIYGNEKEVGEAIRAKIEDGTVKREDLFIINKLWSTFHKEDLVRGACEASLDTMGLDYFDLYLVHNPMSFKEGSSPIPTIATVIQYSQNTFVDAWHGLSSLYKAKLVRAIGVSNFNSKQVQLVMDKGTVRPVINQVECHPYLSQERLRKYCKDRNITLSCFGVLGSKGTPAQYRGIPEAVIDDPIVKVLASGLGITPAQLLIKYQLKNNHTVVVKSSSAAHLWENVQAVNVELTTAEVDGLNMLNKNKRMFNFKGMGDTHKNYPFNIAF